MDNETNSKGTSGKDGGKMKIGDKVWVLCEIINLNESAARVSLVSRPGHFWVKTSDCKPVEPEAVEQPKIDACSKTAIDELKKSLADFPFGEPPAVEQHLTSESGSVEAKYKIGDWVEIVGPKEPTELRRRWDKRMDRYIGMIVEVKALSIPTKNDDALYNLGKCGFWVFREKYLKPASEPCKEKQSDPVNPSHYKQGGIECIEAIKAALGGGFTAYLWGNAHEYTWRWPSKNGIEDLKKARWYLDRLIQEEEAK